jgi:hypothetical protein
MRVNPIVERIANMKIKGGVYQFYSFPRLVSPLHLSPGIQMPKPCIQSLDGSLSN